MRVLVPLYVYPLKDGCLAPEWQQMKEAREAGVPVVAIANPGSGPGTEGDRLSYDKGMQALHDSGVEVIGYVASGYGQRNEDQVTADISQYKDWYGRWLSGIFLDEASNVADNINDGDRVNCVKYKGYREHVQRQFGETATVVMNTGAMSTEAALIDAVGPGVVWNVLEDNRDSLEKRYGKVKVPRSSSLVKSIQKQKRLRDGVGGKKGFFASLFGRGGGGGGGGGRDRSGSIGNSGSGISSSGSGSRRSSRNLSRGKNGSLGGGKQWKTVEGTPPGAPVHVKGRAAFMVHGATGISFEEICHWVCQLHDGGWSYAYITDKVFDPESSNTELHNPWDATPTYWEDFVTAVGEINRLTGIEDDADTTSTSMSS